MQTSVSRLRVLAGILLLPVLGACSDLLNPPAPDAQRQIAISLSSVPAGQARASLASTFARVSAARVEVRHSGTSVLDTTVTFAADQQEGRLRVSVRNEFARDPLAVSVELLSGSSVLFRGASTVVLDRSGTTSVTLPVEAVVGRIVVDREVPTLEAIGATTQLRGAVLFANGDTVPDLRLTWRALDGGVVEVAADGRVTARGEGQARVEGSFDARADTVQVTVNPAIARVAVDPPSLILPVGQTGQVATSLFDSNGNRIEGRVVEWAGSPSSVVELIAPLSGGVVAVRGISAGTATITASAGGFSAVSVVTVTNPMPSLIALSPASRVTGSEGFTLSITGSGFVPGSTVLWNGSGRPSQYVSPTEVRANIPASDLVSSGPVAVTVLTPAPGGGVSSALTFSVDARPRPVPILTTVSPSTRVVGSAGFQLTVTGQGFASDAMVRWNGNDRATLFVSATELRAIIPEGDLSEAGPAAVSVFNPGPGGGLSNLASFSIENPLPTVTSLTPASALAGSGLTTVVVSGNGFVPGSSVRWNGAARATQFIGPTELRVTVTSADLSAAGTAALTVFTPAPGGGISNSAAFTISAQPNGVPSLTGITPSSVTAGSPQMVLTLSGQFFAPGAVVRWNGDPRATEFVGPGELGATVLASDLAEAGTATVTVFNPAPGGGVSGGVEFTISEAESPNPTPTISDLSPSSAPAGSDPFILVVSGTQFVPGAVVRWNGTARATEFVGAGEVRATVLAGDLAEAGTATVTVFNPAPGGGVSGGVEFTISEAESPNPTPTITAISPSSVLAGSGPVVLVVSGTQYVPGAVVRWNGANRATEFVNTGELRATIMSADLGSPGVVAVTVLNPLPGGGESAPRSFTITNIVLSSDSVAFAGIPGGGDPPPDSVAITAGSGPLSGLAVSIAYGAGQPTGWLSATLSSTTAPAMLLLQVNPGTLPTGTYTAVVTITDGGGGERSFPVTFTYTAAVSIPNAPSSLTAVATTRNIIELEWIDNSTNETSFQIERRSGASAYELIATVGPNVTSFSDDPRTGSPAFTYRVRACNPVGCSAYSNEATDK
jgi:hypothetical protein